MQTLNTLNIFKKFNIYLIYTLISLFLYFFLFDVILRKKGTSVLFNRYTVPFYILIFICDLLIYKFVNRSKEKINFKDFLFVSLFGISAIALCLPFSNKNFNINNSKLPLLGYIYGVNHSMNFFGLIENIVILIFSVTFCVFFTKILSKFDKFELSLFIKNMTNYDKYINGIYFGDNFFVLACSVFKPAIIEEIIFRHSILNDFMQFFSRIKLFNSGIYAIVITNIFFSAIHFNLSKNNFIKFIQTFFIGIIFSVIYIKYGLEMAIFTHGLTNVMYGVIMFLDKNNSIKNQKILKIS